jgi:hypothetical protein
MKDLTKLETGPLVGSARPGENTLLLCDSKQLILINLLQKNEIGVFVLVLSMDRQQ